MISDLPENCREAAGPITLSLSSVMGQMEGSVMGGGRASSFIGSGCEQAAGTHHIACRPLKGFEELVSALKCVWLWLPLPSWCLCSFLTFWLPVWPGSVPGEARLPTSPEAMQLSVTKKRSPHAANVTQFDGPGVQENSYPKVGPHITLTGQANFLRGERESRCAPYAEPRSGSPARWLLCNTCQVLHRNDGAFKPLNCLSTEQ